jgi:hypothetical protein
MLMLPQQRKSDQPSLKIPVVLCSAASKTVTATCGKLITLSVWSGVQIVLALASLLYCLIVYGGYKGKFGDDTISIRESAVTDARFILFS